MRVHWKRTTSGLFVPVGTSEPQPPGFSTPVAPADTMAYAIGAVPLLAPLVALLIVGDPAVLRVLLSQGHVPGLFLAQIWPFLPLGIAVAVYLIGMRITRHADRQIVGLSSVATGAALLLFVPMSFAALQIAVLIVAVALARAPRWWWRLLPVTISVVLVALVVMTQVPGFADVTRSRALYGLPRELAVHTDGTVSVYYLAMQDDQSITIITGRPVAVRSMRAAEIALRLPCQHHSAGLSRSAISVLLPDRGGTAWCEDLSQCLQAIPEPQDRSTKAVVERCLGIAGDQPG